MSNVDRPQNIKLSGTPTFVKSVKRYPPGEYIIVLVLYPIGVAKLVEAAKVIAISSGRGSIFRDAAVVKAIGASMAAAALLDIASVNTAVMK